MGLEWEFEDDLPGSSAEVPPEKPKGDYPQPRLRDVHISTTYDPLVGDRHTAVCPSNDPDCGFVVSECCNYEAVLNTMASHIRKAHTPQYKRGKK